MNVSLKTETAEQADVCQMICGGSVIALVSAVWFYKPDIILTDIMIVIWFTISDLQWKTG